MRTQSTAETTKVHALAAEHAVEAATTSAESGARRARTLAELPAFSPNHFLFII